MNSLDKLILTGIAAIVGSEIAKANATNDEEKKKGSIEGALWAAGATFLSCEMFAENDDTINYTLYKRRKRVYDGIAYEDRLDRRLSEHKISGKVFDFVVFDDAKPRSIALEIERKRIRRNKGYYNKHHNA